MCHESENCIQYTYGEWDIPDTARPGALATLMQRGRPKVGPGSESEFFG